MKAFESSVPFYDALSGGKARLEREASLLLGVLEDCPGKQVLDLACGTGIHAQFFAEEGAEVTACDLSADMIDYAGDQRPHPHIDYRVADMRHPPEGSWDLILCLGNSLSLLPSLEAIQGTIAAARDRLKTFDRALQIVLPNNIIPKINQNFKIVWHDTPPQKIFFDNFFIICRCLEKSKSPARSQ